jgi:hypothetical protein
MRQFISFLMLALLYHHDLDSIVNSILITVENLLNFVLTPEFLDSIGLTDSLSSSLDENSGLNSSKLKEALKEDSNSTISSNNDYASNGKSTDTKPKKDPKVYKIVSDAAICVILIVIIDILCG